MFLYKFTFFLVVCLGVQIGYGRHTGLGPEEHEVIPPVIQALANEPVPKDPLAIDDFRNHAINVGNMIAELLRHEMRMLSRISKTPIGSPSLMMEPTNAIIPGGASSSVGSNQVPVTTTVITTYAGAPPSLAISNPQSSPNPVYTQSTPNQGIETNYIDNTPLTIIANPSTETQQITNSIAGPPMVQNTQQQMITDEQSYLIHLNPDSDIMSDSGTLYYTPLTTPPAPTNTLITNQQDILTSTVQSPTTVVGSSWKSSEPNGQFGTDSSQPPPTLTVNPLVTNQLQGYNGLSSPHAPEKNSETAVQPINQPTQPTVIQPQPQPVVAPPAASQII